MSKEKLRKVWEGEVNCSWCNKANSIKIQKKVIEPAVPAETEIVVSVEKATQTRLDT
jgi:hypothetical protein